MRVVFFKSPDRDQHRQFVETKDGRRRTGGGSAGVCEVFGAASSCRAELSGSAEESREHHGEQTDSKHCWLERNVAFHKTPLWWIHPLQRRRERA